MASGLGQLVEGTEKKLKDNMREEAQIVTSTLSASKSLAVDVPPFLFQFPLEVGQKSPGR